MVIATQNPVEQEGTYRLPESQLDRFLMRMSLGYPDRTAELAILDNLGPAAALPRPRAGRVDRRGAWRMIDAVRTVSTSPMP